MKTEFNRAQFQHPEEIDLKKEFKCRLKDLKLVKLILLQFAFCVCSNFENFDRTTGGPIRMQCGFKKKTNKIMQSKTKKMGAQPSDALLLFLAEPPWQSWQ